MYQFIAKDISPPFILSLPQPHTLLPLPDMVTEPARLYHNHVVIVETLDYEGQDCMALSIFDDVPSSLPLDSVLECDDSEGQ